MHEMALAESMLEIVEQTARDNGAGCVTLVRIEIGALSHVEPEALRFCFDVVTRASLADGARLDIRTTPGEAWCMPCGTTVPLPRLGDACPIAAAISSRSRKAMRCACSKSRLREPRRASGISH